MKKGFTLAELLGVLVILAAILLIIMPIVDKTIKEGKDDLYDKQVNSIKLAMELWLTDHAKLDEGEYIVITLSQLKDAGLIEFDIKNPKTEELFPNDMVLTIENNNDELEYIVSTEGENITDYELLPSISIIGNELTYVEINSKYVDQGVIVKDNNNNIIQNATYQIISPKLEISKKGIYLESYNINLDGYKNTVYRTIIVRDTIGPEISFNNNLELTYEQSRTYDFKSDITVKDNSGENVEVVVEDNIRSLPGKYTVKYTAKDTSGNETVKTRIITIKE